MSPVRNIIRAATKKENEPYNIITFLSNQKYEKRLSLTGNNFYYWSHNYASEWDDKAGDKPDNCIFLPDSSPELPSYIDFDLILCPNRGMFQLAKQISNFSHLPMVALEHSSPDDEFKAMNPEQWQAFHNMEGDINVFASDECRQGWQKMGYVASLQDENFDTIWNNIFKEACSIIYTRM